MAVKESLFGRCPGRVPPRLGSGRRRCGALQPAVSLGGAHTAAPAAAYLCKDIQNI